MEQFGHMVVIGGSSGIGFATASQFARSGGRVTIVARNQEKIEAALQRLGSGAEGAAVDARDRDGLDALFKRIEAIDHLVIAASSGVSAGPFNELKTDYLRKGFEAKFWAHFNVAQSALPFMANSGSITFVTGATSRFANPGTVGLAAVNGAIGQLVPTLARELAPLRVNAVSPGVIDTPWWSDKPSEQLERQARKAPLARAGRPEEVADAILFLARNQFVTGIILDVDGGLHLT